MKKNQIIVSIAAVAAVALMLSLPKVVVDNKGNDNNMEARQDVAEVVLDAGNETPDTAAANPHAAALPAETRATINNLREKYQSSENSEKNINFAASLVEAYENAAVFDSAAWFAAEIAGKTKEQQDYQRAGRLYYEAYTHAVDASQAQRLGDKARAFLEKVVSSDSADLDSKTKLAMTYVSTSNPMQGIVMLREVLAADENNEAAIYNLGLLSLQSGQYDKAAERFEKLVTLQPEHIQGHYWLGVSYFELKKKKQARKQFERIKQLDGDPEITASADNYLDRL